MLLEIIACSRLSRLHHTGLDLLFHCRLQSIIFLRGKDF
jgi:hypothetical protein